VLAHFHVEQDDIRRVALRVVKQLCGRPVGVDVVAPVVPEEVLDVRPEIRIVIEDRYAYQLRRSPNWRARAPLPEFMASRIPVALLGVLGIPGMLNTLKKSMFNRKKTRSLTGITLKSEAC
jgi:hypothetical protein